MIKNGGNLLDYDWKFASSSNAGIFGGKITAFSRNVEKYALDFSIASNSKEMFTKALDHLLEVTEKDVLALTPGRLYVDDYYILCYIHGDKKTKWERLIESMDGTLSIVSPYPIWCKETKYTFSKDRESTSVDGRYPYGYPYDYASMFNKENIINTHYAPNGFRMIIYGPCENPAVYIGGNSYQVHTEILKNEYVVIDSREKTVSLMKNTGVRKNIFNSRNKESNIFKAIPPGNNTIVWEGEFWFDLVIITERSAPKWIL